MWGNKVFFLYAPAELDNSLFPPLLGTLHYAHDLYLTTSMSGKEETI